MNIFISSQKVIAKSYITVCNSRFITLSNAHHRETDTRRLQQSAKLIKLKLGQTPTHRQLSIHTDCKILEYRLTIDFGDTFFVDGHISF